MKECPIRLELRRDGYYELSFRTSKNEATRAILNPAQLGALALMVRDAVAADPYLEEVVARLEAQ